MRRVLVVDDEVPARDRMKKLLAAHADVEVVGEAGDGVDALVKIDALAPDVVLLDIAMPEIDGIAVAAAIRSRDVAVIFCTAFDQHAVRAFELAATDYLVKPVTKERLAAALLRARERAREGRASPLPALPVRKMALRVGGSYTVFDIDAVKAFLAKDHYTEVLLDGRDLLSDDSLDTLESRLDAARFVRVHRSAIVNVDAVTQLRQDGDRKFVALLDDAARTEVPISRERLDAVKSRFGMR